MPATWAFAALLLAGFAVEGRLLLPVFRTRAASLAEFRAQHLERLHELPIAAFDVGYIGYFTESPLCDMAGLVNGRAVARLPFAARVTRCAAQRPPYAFVSGFSLADLDRQLDLRDWSLCSIYDLANLRSADLHYLIASPAVAAEVCAAAGRAPTPLAPLLPPVAGR